MINITCFSIALIASLTLAGQPATPPALQDPPKEVAKPQGGQKATVHVDTSTYELGPEDQIKIWAFGMEEISDKPIRVDPSGFIDLPMVGRIHVAGLTAEQLRTTLVERLAKEVRKPQVSIEIVEFGSQPVSVMGSVNHPGVVQLRGRKTLSEVLSMVDGLKPDAGFRINISRETQYGAIPLANAKTDPTGRFSLAEVGVKELLAGKHPENNILVLPHDVITIPTAEMVYVVGAVQKPGGIVLNDDESISVLQAVALAGGVGGPAPPAPQNARILRPVPGSGAPQEIPVDIRQLYQGKGENIALKPKDTLFIPESGPKKITTQVIQAAIQAATGIVVFRGGYPGKP